MSIARKQIDQPLRAIRLAYTAAESSRHPDVCSEATSQAGNEFWMIAEWAGNGVSLAFHAESLIGWAPVEMLDRPTPIIDETDQPRWLCKFRYVGPSKDRARLVENVKAVLASLTDWHPVRTHSL